MLRNWLASMLSLAVVVVVVSQPAAAGLQSSVVTLLAPPHTAVERVSFWARPYPYGYSGWRGCRYHRVKIETPYGRRWRRVCI